MPHRKQAQTLSTGVDKPAAGAWIIGLWLVYELFSLWLKPILVIDETRYLAVAWEMWQRSDFLVPYLNGAPYPHKPPLLFWLIQAGWSLFGVNAWWPRLLPLVFALAGVFLTRQIALLLWRDEKTGKTALLLMSGTVSWAFYASLILFDLILSFWVLATLFAGLKSGLANRMAGWWLAGLAIGAGLLTKGPVMLLHCLPPLLLAPLWPFRKPVLLNRRRWYLGVFAATSLGLILLLSWVIPAALEGGPAYSDNLIWKQTGGRLSHSFAHSHPIGWYLPWLPVLLFPWSLSPPIWRGLRKIKLDDGLIFCLIWLLPVFLLFSLISGKRLHYLLPLVPAALLIGARLWDFSVQRTIWDWMPNTGILIVLAMILGLKPVLLPETLMNFLHERSIYLGIGIFFLCLMLPRLFSNSALTGTAGSAIAFMTALLAAINFQSYDCRPLALVIARLQEEGREIGHWGKYHGQYQFLGRLQRPLLVFHQPSYLVDWLEKNPEGYLVFYAQPHQCQFTRDNPDKLWMQDFRSKKVFLVQASWLLKRADENQGKPEPACPILSKIIDARDRGIILPRSRP